MDNVHLINTASNLQYMSVNNAFNVQNKCRFNNNLQHIFPFQ